MNSDTIKVIYGQSVPLEIEVDYEDGLEVTFYVAKAGQPPVIVETATINKGVAELLITDTQTKIPLGTYLYQVNVVDSNGNVLKFPEPEGCDDDCKPKFIVYEALDETEVVS